MYTVLKDLICRKHPFASLISVQITLGVDPGDVEQVNICEIGTAITINDENNTANSLASYDRDIDLDNENVFTDSDNELIVNVSQQMLAECFKVLSLGSLTSQWPNF
ncbi:1883_t:CDS:2 [Cetraspora pellucida]|uniref:1883_t:CDS:1 n=1 Tax=Cetraspora pellucida TaxID=1433469 RepID=A0ACA9KZ29_9GLOM|nr:1883_t:CDS:2 [Cetraspora pellucida]